MNVLLDTHAALWFLAGDPRLSRKARKTIESEENRRFLSDASLWEICIKQSIGKLKLAEPFEAKLTLALERNAIGKLPLERTHFFGVAKLPFHHRDPFDRLLISAALIEEMPIVTIDPSFRQYPVAVIW
jgi:PIN domain nuclease of toxin-antitoxin system